MLARRLKLIPSVILCITFAVSAKSQTIVGSFSTPGNEARGLAWDGEYLWCADADADTVYKLNPSNGTIVASFPFSIGFDYGGMTWSDDNNVWIANGSRIYKVDPTNGNSLTSFDCGCW
jgi:DNA-binding beta-propeller fold protein YncE